jgi:hypothetical protein
MIELGPLLGIILRTVICLLVVSTPLMAVVPRPMGGQCAPRRDGISPARHIHNSLTSSNRNGTTSLVREPSSFNSSRMQSTALNPRDSWLGSHLHHCATRKLIAAIDRS